MYNVRSVSNQLHTHGLWDVRPCRGGSRVSQKWGPAIFFGLKFGAQPKLPVSLKKEFSTNEQN